MKRFLLSLLALGTAATALRAQSSCMTAQSITLGTYTVAPLTGAPPTAYCVGGGSPSYGAWFRFTAANDTMLRLSTYVEGYPTVDTRFHVYSGSCVALTCVAGDDDTGPGYSSIANFEVEAGVTYTIAFDSYWTANGFTFQLSELFVPPPPEGMVTFTAVSIPGSGAIMGAVDMNDDGRDDAVAPGYTSFTVSHQQPGGGFTPTTYPTTAADNTASWSFAVGDWDSNGHRDLLYGGGSGATFMKANADGTAYTEISFPEYIFSQRTNFVDINLDGHLDAFVCHDVDANVAFINDGLGNLTFTQGGYGTTCGNYGSIFTDIDNDGAMDLFVAKCGCDPNDLMMLNDGVGAFTNVAPAQGLADGHQSWSSAWGDFDNDGDMDVLIGASSSGYHKLMLNDGAGGFSNATAASGMDTWSGQSIEWTAHDFNNDGWVDILGGGALHYNNGNGTFSHDADAPDNHAIGDMNNDGFLDICTGSGYHRNGGNANNWIRINPVGSLSNRDAIGARVTITSALGTQIRDIRSGDGFRYMSFIGAHFGLGSDTQVEEVSIRWPNGDVEVIKGPAINTVHTIVQGTFTSVPGHEEPSFSIAPNPATEQVTLSGYDPMAPVEVLDATGKLVWSGRVAAGRLSVSALPQGAYLVRVLQPDGIRQARFVKQ
ncbi:MAG: FG-GAP-like repeat-containing protein [Flavobacteriales bacterium]|nr:MAG: FG-GAP-like repeat-containing protein [Flavobacteriales bacterium]